MSADNPRLELPDVPHWPGRTPRPAEAVFAPFIDALPERLAVEAYATSPAFQAGLEAFRRGYFWEAHELWEAVWTRLPPASAERFLLRGAIQLANAGLKRRMGRAGAAERLLALADEALAEAARRGLRGEGFSPPLLRAQVA